MILHKHINGLKIVKLGSELSLVNLDAPTYLIEQHEQRPQPLVHEALLPGGFHLWQYVLLLLNLPIFLLLLVLLTYGLRVVRADRGLLQG